MKQYRYILNEHLFLEDMIKKIKNLPEYQSGQKALMQVVEQDCIPGPIQRDLSTIKEELPTVQVYGMTSHGALSRSTHSIRYTVCSLLFFERSDFEIHVYDCHNQTPAEAGEKYRAVLEAQKDIRGILMMSSDFSLCPERFIDKINEFDQSIVVFGALAGTKRMGDDKSLIYVGDQIYDRGILTVVFTGENLHLEHYYNLGFKPLGKELIVTESDEEGVVHQINGKPAFYIYRDHLGVDMDEYFFENTSSFPFMFQQDGRYVARVALDYHKEDGALAFAVEIPKGTCVSLGYATNRYLLEESNRNAENLQTFYPEAIMIYVCMSRRMLMGDDLAELEFDCYENVKSSATWAHGYGEILHADGLRGVLNASLVAIGMREGEIPEEEDRPEFHPMDLAYLIEEEYRGYVPLATRLVKFLETTTDDLREAVSQLFKVASMDDLTQIYNRRALNYFMKQFLENHRFGNEVAVLMVDIDHFKHVNDTYGHDVGDVILREGVDMVKAHVTQKDVIGRWGGEEFIMISPNTSAEEAKRKAEMIRKAVEEFTFDVVGHITVSCGVTMIRDGDDDELIFKRVDDALYEAKETGRNKVVYR